MENQCHKCHRRECHLIITDELSPEGRWCSRCIVIHIASVEQERDRLKRQCMDAECPGANFIAEGSAEWEERAKNAESKLKVLTTKLQARDEALSAARTLRLCFPDSMEDAEFNIPRYILDEFDKKLGMVEAVK